MMEVDGKVAFREEKVESKWEICTLVYADKYLALFLYLKVA